jgi:hypothetical protein
MKNLTAMTVPLKSVAILFAVVLILSVSAVHLAYKTGLTQGERDGRHDANNNAIDAISFLMRDGFTMKGTNGEVDRFKLTPVKQ